MFINQIFFIIYFSAILDTVTGEMGRYLTPKIDHPLLKRGPVNKIFIEERINMIFDEILY